MLACCQLSSRSFEYFDHWFYINPEDYKFLSSISTIENSNETDVVSIVILKYCYIIACPKAPNKSFT